MIDVSSQRNKLAPPIKPSTMWIPHVQTPTIKTPYTYISIWKFIWMEEAKFLREDKCGMHKFPLPLIIRQLTIVRFKSLFFVRAIGCEIMTFYKFNSKIYGRTKVQTVTQRLLPYHYDYDSPALFYFTSPNINTREKVGGETNCEICVATTGLWILGQEIQTNIVS